jgi:hypothetical protein
MRAGRGVVWQKRERPAAPPPRLIYGSWRRPATTPTPRHPRPHSRRCRCRQGDICPLKPGPCDNSMNCIDELSSEIRGSGRSPKARLRGMAGGCPRQISISDRKILGKVSKGYNRYLRALAQQVRSAQFKKGGAICPLGLERQAQRESHSDGRLRQSLQNTNIAASAKLHSKPEFPRSGAPPVILSIQSGEMINATRRPIATRAARSPIDTGSPGPFVTTNPPKKKCAPLSSPDSLNNGTACHGRPVRKSVFP